MTCNDCIHSGVCAIQLEPHYILDRAQKLMRESNNVEHECLSFKERSRFVELKHAEWVEDEDMYGDPIYRCSACSERFILEEGTPTDNGYSYCPNCGAKMDEQALKEHKNEVSN